jgi:putative Ca2+/H+ antiporter (TMEM165/GDT1 family)
MDAKLFATTFVTVFLAELGDKTQIATLGIAAGSRARWTVFLAAALALVLTSAIAVLGGELVSRVVSPSSVRRAAGVLFIALGVLYLITASKGATA